MSSKTQRPTSLDSLVELISQAAADGSTFELRGGGTKADFGASRDTHLLDMGAFGGVIDYDPAELVLTVGAATPLASIEALLAAHQQMLAFEPIDAASQYGTPPRSTIGGVVASGAAGSRRLSRGGARDHLLGFKGVSGRGETLIGGAKVVKNVTGYDLPKLIAGSWGRLVALTEVTLKTLPRPTMQQTLVLKGLSAGNAIAAMAKALGSHADVAAAAHDPSGSGLTGLRLEGFEPSVVARREFLRGILAEYSSVDILDEIEAQDFWYRFQALNPLGFDRPLWRLVIPPSCCLDILTKLEGQWLMDWGGGLIWLASAAEPGAIRSTVEAAGGRAMLVRAPEEMRAVVPALHPRTREVNLLEARIRNAFDPFGVFETGRFLDLPHAN